jgi:hypothetical protein
MKGRPKKGDLVEAHSGNLTKVGVVVGSIFSWATMDDSFIVQLNDGARRIHVPRDQLSVISDK